jgi:hypothetical protein
MVMKQSLLIRAAIGALAGAVAFTPSMAASLKVVAEFGGAILRITNIGDGPVTINSVEINNGSCRATVSAGFRQVSNPNIPRERVTFKQNPPPTLNGEVEVYCYRPTASNPWKAIRRVDRPPEALKDSDYNFITTEEAARRMNLQCKPAPRPWCPVIRSEIQAAFYNTHNNVGCFDHEPTEADIENFNKPTKNLTITVEDTKDLGGVTLIVGQSTTGRVTCSPGVTDIVRAKIDTDQGSETYEFQQPQ